MPGSTRIIPLGGLGEVGKNMTVIEADGEAVVIDAGLAFPRDEHLGVDLILPDFSYLMDRDRPVRAVLLTHGHEDHVGALAYILKKYNLPVYGSRFTLALAEKRLEEFRMLDDVLLHRVQANDVIEIGNFSVGFIHASHSLVDCFSLAIKTPLGTIIHTGDYKIDDTPVIGKPYDLETLRKYGDEGVLVLLADSTNSMPGM